MTARGRHAAPAAAALALLLAGCGGTSAAGPGAPGPSAAAAPGPSAPASPYAGSGLEPPPLQHASARLEDRQLEPTTAPLRLTVPALGVDQEVVPVGVDAAGLLDVPEDAGSVSWYRHGAGIGGSGSAVLAGHVDFGGREGVFWRLDELAVGDEVGVAVEGGLRSYRVVSLEQHAKTALPLAELFDVDGPPRLVLITCGGSFDAARGSYRDNVVVVAEPVA